MRRWMFFAVILLILPVSAVCQSGSTDSQTLQALLAEVRQLRQELRTTTIASQRAQILIYRVQAQQAVVTRLSQRVENDRSRLSQTQSEQKRLVVVIKRLEDLRYNQSESERKQTEEQLSQLKPRAEQLGNEEQESLARKVEIEEELRLEQAKLAQLHDELDRIDKALEQTSRAPATAP
ncbi:MAG TPA: hypothetical protein VN943_08695 [Candidatus Acidoferrum sp.]|nr:hypothetical protein [Candidatus Acidoferrum sp.]